MKHEEEQPLKHCPLCRKTLLIPPADPLPLQMISGCQVAISWSLRRWGELWRDHRKPSRVSLWERLLCLFLSACPILLLKLAELDSDRPVESTLHHFCFMYLRRTAWLVRPHHLVKEGRKQGTRWRCMTEGKGSLNQWHPRRSRGTHEVEWQHKPSHMSALATLQSSWWWQQPCNGKGRGTCLCTVAEGKIPRLFCS